MLLGVGGRKSGTWVPPGSWRYAGGEGKQQVTGPEQPRPRGFLKIGAGGPVTFGHPAGASTCAPSYSASHGPPWGLHLGVGLLLSLVEVLGGW